MEQITTEILSSYFQCKRKSFLILKSSNAYKKTEFELMIEKYASDTKISYCSDKKAEVYYDGIFEEGINYIQDVNKQISDYQLRFDLLHKKSGESIWGNFHYEQIIFSGQNKISKHDRIKLALQSFMFEKIQGMYPKTGIIVKRDGSQQHIKIENLYPEIKNAIIEIKEFREKEPPIFLNKACNICAYENCCKTKAVKDSNLSLLEKITEKKITQFEQKGIFTVTQLSYLYKPRRKRKKSKPNYIFRPEIQALAIRTKKTYLSELPMINKNKVYYILDIESVPDADFYYLFGILRFDNDKSSYFPFWSNSIADELSSWKKAIGLLNEFIDAPIFHYGNYELKVFEKLSIKYEIDVAQTCKRFININTFIYGKIYFPTYSNRLKELAGNLGFKWRNVNASGIRCIVWRYYWEQGKNDYKATIIEYNEDDCIALRTLIDELECIQNYADKLKHIDFVDKLKDNSTAIGKDLHDNFDIVLELAHHKYDSKKIKVNFEKNKISKSPKVNIQGNKYKWFNRSLTKPEKSVFYPPDKYCFIHKNRRLNKSKLKYKRVKLDLVFTKNGIRKNIIEHIGQQGYCPICNNTYASLKFRKIDRTMYGHNLKAWVVFQRIEIQLSFSKIRSSLYGLINERINDTRCVVFIEEFSKYYEETETTILKNLLKSSFIHIDETTVNILGENQYVWVLSSNKFVLLKLTKNRDSTMIKELIKGYKGVLISDFFGGYDSVDCIQQKCWVHLIRDLNNDLWKNPFDKEYEEFVVAIRNVIIPIIESAYKFGLKKYHFVKHKKFIAKFYKEMIDDRFYKSELCKTYQKRFKRYKNSLFTFIDFDGISWHNNIAENRIRHICIQRKISGSFGPLQFPHYLRMLSIMQTCRLHNKSFLGFLLSKQKDIENFNYTKRTFEKI